MDLHLDLLDNVIEWVGGGSILWEDDEGDNEDSEDDDSDEDSEGDEDNEDNEDDEDSEDDEGDEDEGDEDDDEAYVKDKDSQDETNTAMSYEQRLNETQEIIQLLGGEDQASGKLCFRKS